MSTDTEVEVALLRLERSGELAATPWLGSTLVRLREGKGETTIPTPTSASLSPEERAAEGYFVIAALIGDDGHTAVLSPPLEVIVSPFAFGL